MTPQDVETALEKMGLPTYGTDQEKLERLRRNGKHHQLPSVGDTLAVKTSVKWSSAVEDSYPTLVISPDAPRKMGRPKKDK